MGGRGWLWEVLAFLPHPFWRIPGSWLARAAQTWWSPPVRALRSPALLEEPRLVPGRFGGQACGVNS